MQNQELSELQQSQPLYLQKEIEFEMKENQFEQQKQDEKRMLNAPKTKQGRVCSKHLQEHNRIYQ